METFKLTSLTKPNLKRAVQLTEHGIGNYAWLAMEAVDLSEAEHQKFEAVTIVKLLKAIVARSLATSTGHNL